MRIWSTLLIAAPVVAGLLAAPAAYANSRDHRDWHGEWHGDRDWHHHDHDNGGAAAAAILGLGAAAIVGGLIASQQPQYLRAAASSGLRATSGVLSGISAVLGAPRSPGAQNGRADRHGDIRWCRAPRGANFGEADLRTTLTTDQHHLVALVRVVDRRQIEPHIFQ